MTANPSCFRSAGPVDPAAGRVRRRRSIGLLIAHGLAASALLFSRGDQDGASSLTDAVPIRGRSTRGRGGEEPIEVDAIEGRRSLAVTDGLLLDLTNAFMPGREAEAVSRHRELIDLTPEHLDRYPFTNLADVSSGPVRDRSSSYGQSRGRGARGRRRDRGSRGRDEQNQQAAGANTGFYWQIPRSGGTTLKHLFGTCLDRVQASRVSKDHCDTDSDTLEICQTRFGRFVNADPSDDPGILRSSQMGLVPSGLPHVVVSSRFLHAATLFDSSPGRAFTVLRHPVERAASTFYYLRDATWERTYNPEFKTMSLVDYAARPDTPHDWMVRWLTGKNHEDLSRADLDFAKALLRRKFFLLLTDDMPASIDRLVIYMGWDDVTPSMRKCAREAAAKDMGKNGHVHHRVQPGTEEYKALRDINSMDIELYDFAVNELMHEQWAFVYSGVGVTVDYEEGGKDEKERGNEEKDEKVYDPRIGVVDAKAENERYRKARAGAGINEPYEASAVERSSRMTAPEQVAYLERFNFGGPALTEGKELESPSYQRAAEEVANTVT